ncbi:lytic transglycosylase domain-containing protein [Streptosporangium sp. NBC_01810]|uniref:lytic transglycosylase domain-containing protein n=1 Tax=Streptosporangium sp. NBC_01810 TaxID=2975951 RepID=UPI002DD83F1D|nr:lytic murein transglycosylase [Streptosporangium sp. NBC_01810]
MSRLPGLRVFVPVVVALTALVALGGVALAVITGGRPAAPDGNAVVESRIRDLSALAPVVGRTAVPPATADAANPENPGSPDPPSPDRGSPGPNNPVGGEAAPENPASRPSSAPGPVGTAAPGPVGTAAPGPVGTAGPGPASTPPRLLVISPSTLTEQTKEDISRLKYVQKIDSFDGGAVKVSGVGLNLIAVDPDRFRAWAPRAVADQQGVWSALARGEFVADSSAARRLGLVLGAEYQVDDGPRLRAAASATFGLPGVDGIVGTETGRRLGLLPGVALLVHGPRKATAVLKARVGRLLGPGSHVVAVGAAATAKTTTDKTTTDKITTDKTTAGKTTTDKTTAGKTTTGGSTAKAARVTVGRPGSYLELYRRSAEICPGLSWTVLAAIGQVESSHGRNNGPSSAGAQGPMQFMPATWKAYGVDGDGDGVADIWSPYDAVPSAANYLCANGAAQGGKKLEKAIWFYNHSWSYVSKVLAISRGYADAYP